jgi:histidinol-phosphate/aromatic aminotransferase/cobyric acid decarboxylase-like protein
MGKEILRHLEPCEPGVSPALAAGRYEIPEFGVASKAFSEDPYVPPRSILTALWRVLDEGYLRLTVGRPAGNRRLVRALWELPETAATTRRAS